MELRIFLVGLQEAVERPLRMYIESLGHQTVVAPAPEACPLYHSAGHVCPQDESCGDAILLGRKLPLLEGLDFIERRKMGGCKGIAANNAIICHDCSCTDRERLRELGVDCFDVPLNFLSIERWLVGVEKRIRLHRKLA